MDNTGRNAIKFLLPTLLFFYTKFTKQKEVGIFCAGAIIQSFFLAVENFFKKDLVCKVIVFTFALQI